MKNPSTIPTASPGPIGSGADAVPAIFSHERFERILRLQRQAVDPLNPVAAVMAQSQLAQVEVPWLTRQLQLAQSRLHALTSEAPS